MPSKVNISTSYSKLTSFYIGSSIWGYTVDGREFVTIAQRDRAAFAEVVGKGWWNYVPFIGKAEGNLDYIGRLPQYSVPSLRREIRDYIGRYAIIGSEAVGHGIQIFDMRKVRRAARHSQHLQIINNLSSY